MRVPAARPSISTVRPDASSPRSSPRPSAGVGALGCRAPPRATNRPTGFGSRPKLVCALPGYAATAIVFATTADNRRRNSYVNIRFAAPVPMSYSQGYWLPARPPIAFFAGHCRFREPARTRHCSTGLVRRDRGGDPEPRAGAEGTVTGRSPRGVPVAHGQDLGQPLPGDLAGDGARQGQGRDDGWADRSGVAVPERRVRDPCLHHVAAHPDHRRISPRLPLAPRRVACPVWRWGLFSFGGRCRGNRPTMVRAGGRAWGQGVWPSVRATMTSGWGLPRRAVAKPVRRSVPPPTKEIPSSRSPATRSRRPSAHHGWSTVGDRSGRRQ